LFKQCALAVQYGMEADSLAARIGAPTIVARDLLRAHRTTYSRFWEWIDGAVDYAMLHGSIHTVFGWPIHRGVNANPRMLRNFPMQGNGAEMLRLACCYATEAGIAVCAPVHDALLIEAPVDAIANAVVATQSAMSRASRDVLFGFELRSDANIVAYPDRYMDERGLVMWQTVQELLGAGERRERRVQTRTGYSCACAANPCACAHPVPSLSLDLISPPAPDPRTDG
jgi:hypothetical protein